MPEITDEYMRTMLTRSAPYSVVILHRGPAYGEPGSEAVVWEHGRRNFELRAAGLLAVVCPVPDDSDVCGVGIFTPQPGEVARLMDEDPASSPASSPTPCTPAAASPVTACLRFRPRRRPGTARRLRPRLARPHRPPEEAVPVQVSRAHVLDIIARSGLTPEQRERVLALEYPADFEHVLTLFRSMGVNHDELISRMGGSP